MNKNDTDVQQERKATKPSLAGLKLLNGHVDPAYGALSQFLVDYGYMEDQHISNTCTEHLLVSLGKFQKFNNLPETQQLDNSTSLLMSRPRCGVADLSTQTQCRIKGTRDRFWHHTILDFAYIPNPIDAVDAMRPMFEEWERHLPFKIKYGRPDGQRPDFIVSSMFPDARTGHGNRDGNPFDGFGGVLAHAFYPPPCGGAWSGHCHFDGAEPWGLEHSTGWSYKRDMQTVLLHEIGHLLGLRHSPEAGSVMNAYYSGERRELTTVDIKNVKKLYGT